VEEPRLHISADDTSTGYVYVLFTGVSPDDNKWYVGVTRDLEARMKYHIHKETYKRGRMYGLIKCYQASTAFRIEQFIHDYPYLWNKEVLKWLVLNFGGSWNERGVNVEGTGCSSIFYLGSQKISKSSNLRRRTRNPPEEYE